MVTAARGVSFRLILAVGLVATVFAYLVLRLWTERGGVLPQASWGSLVVLVFMACGVLSAGLPVRRFLRGRATKPLNPIRAMRTVVLAQASALTGALVTGWYVAQVLVLLPDFDIPSRRALATVLAALAAGGVLMAVAGLATQSMCRVGGDHSDRNGDHEQDPDGSEQH